jgi:hypothetical protein
MCLVESDIINKIHIVDQQSDVVIVFLGCFVHVHVNVLVSIDVHVHVMVGKNSSNRFPAITNLQRESILPENAHFFVITTTE